jgi:hypothetical protein
MRKESFNKEILFFIYNNKGMKAKRHQNENV